MEDKEKKGRGGGEKLGQLCVCMCIILY
jgi:hypothetical protein